MSRTPKPPPLARLSQRQADAPTGKRLERELRQQFAGTPRRMPPWKRAGNALLRVLGKGTRGRHHAD